MKSTVEHYLVKCIYPSTNMYCLQSAIHLQGPLDHRRVTGGQNLIHVYIHRRTKFLNHTHDEGAMKSYLHRKGKV